ncbi:MAG TPA: hypothetical protein DD465_20830 [Thalassospira sp.]|nr:hypothetical protein [Thalassospira sp.]
MIYFGRLETESHRALMDMMGANPVFLSQTDLPPILAIGARNDEIIQSELVNHTAKRLGADCILLDDIAHAMMLDAKWEKAASQIAKWLEKNVIEKQDSTSKKTAA